MHAMTNLLSIILNTRSTYWLTPAMSLASVRFTTPVGCVRYHTEDTCIWQTDGTTSHQITRITT